MYPIGNERDRVFYEQTYAAKLLTGNTSRMIPDDEVVDAVAIVEPGPALDIGCGQGGNSLYMAMHGFRVKAVDLSEIAIRTLKLIVMASGLPIQADVANIRHELLPDEYQLIVCAYVLDHLNQDQIHELVARMKDKTRPGGINVIIAFAQDGINRYEVLDYVDGKPRHYVLPGELERLYADWDIIDAFYDEDDVMLPGEHSIRMIVRKPL